MEDFILQQINFFAVAVLTGITGGILLDFFRSLRKGKKQRETLVAVEDILLWICEAVLVFVAVYRFNSGEIRFYFFLGFAVGLIIYLVTVSRAIIFVFFKTERIFINILKMVCFLTRKIIGIFLSPMLFVGKISVSFAKRVIKRLKKTKKLLKMY